MPAVRISGLHHSSFTCFFLNQYTILLVHHVGTRGILSYLQTHIKPVAVAVGSMGTGC